MGYPKEETCVGTVDSGLVCLSGWWFIAARSGELSELEAIDVFGMQNYSRRHSRGLQVQEAWFDMGNLGLDRS
jgi:hypothetical protein